MRRTPAAPCPVTKDELTWSKRTGNSAHLLTGLLPVRLCRGLRCDAMRQGHHRPRPGGAGRVGEDRLPLGTSGTWVLWGFCADLHANNQDMPGLSSAPELRAGKAEKRKNGGKGPPANTSCVPQQRLTYEPHVEVESGKWAGG